MASPRSNTIAGSAVIVVAMRWTNRLIGIVSTLILARLLVPEDFGIVAMASVVVGLVDVLLDFGVQIALIQNSDAQRADYDSAWTIRLGQSAAAALAIAIAAAPAAGFFGDDRVGPVLWLMSLSVLLGGLENIGIVDFQKRMQFGRDFRFFFTKRLIGFVVTIALAIVLRSYWAMVVGALASRVAGVVLSYWMHPYRPRPSLTRFHHIWSVSQWVLVRNVGSYADRNLDRLLLGRGSSAAVVGSYSLASEISAMPTSELLTPLNRVLFPAFVGMSSDPPRLVRAYRTAMGVQSTVAVPAGTGLALVAPVAVPLLLGAQWTSAIPLVQILSFISVLLALGASSANLLLSLGRIRLQAMLVWFQVGLFGAGALTMLPEIDPQALAWLRLAVGAAGLLALLAMVMRAVPAIGIGALVAEIWRPLAATGLMVAAIVALPDLSGWQAVLQLLGMILVGGISYAATLLALWWATGRPDGAEAYLLNVVRARLAARSAPKSPQNGDPHP